jgi:hypothetical protein
MDSERPTPCRLLFTACPAAYFTTLCCPRFVQAVRRVFSVTSIWTTRIMHGQGDRPETQRFKHPANLVDAYGNIVPLAVCAAIAGKFNRSMVTHKHLCARFYLN